VAPPDPQRAARTYLRKCAEIVSSGAGTDEQSFYPPLNEFLAALGENADPPITPISNPAARGGDLPDVACWEASSNVLALPVEVKPERMSPKQLLKLTQAKRYARTFGGGHVLLTNLRTFIWAELTDADRLEERDRVELLADGTSVAGGAKGLANGESERLLEMLRAAWSLRPVMDEPSVVARLLAYHAKRLDESFEAASDPEALLRPVTESLKEGFGMDLDARFLVGTVVQTLIYGIFAAWLDAKDPRRFRWQDADHALELDAFASLFHAVTAPELEKAVGLDRYLSATARVLNWVDRDVFEERFGSSSIEYFYEPFLGAFDPDLRDRLGVWYTPREIAEYQVSRVDHHLRRDFKLEDGIASDEALTLDPACGTGTYLAAVLRRIYAHQIESGEPEETAARRTLEAAHTRVLGFEVLPAPFVICHLHLHRVLTRELGVRRRDIKRLRVYLTNALTGWGAGVPPPALPLHGLEDELREALEVKAHEPVLAILGNPPYQGFSAAETEEELELAKPWIEPLWPVWRLRKHRLGDLYVRFWRVAIRKIAELHGRGVISFITNRKWLGGRSYPAMREDILRRFQKLVIDDLRGDVRAAGRDPEGSVFSTTTAAGIRVGVAISTAVRYRDPRQDELARVDAREVPGTTGAEKRDALSRYRGRTLNRGLERRHPVKQGGWKLTATPAEDAPGLDDYMTWRRSGVQPVRDDALTDHDRDALEKRMQDYFDDRLEWDKLARRHPAFEIARTRYDPPAVRSRVLARSSYDSDRIVRFLYRPYELRWLYWQLQGKLLNEARGELDPVHSVDGQRYIVQAETPRRADGARPLVTTAVPAFASVDPDARAFPRLLPVGESTDQLSLDGAPEDEVTTNVSPLWISAVREAGGAGHDLEIGDRVFFALIAVMHSPAWSAAIPEDLGEFAGVPLPRDPGELEEAAKIGRAIADIADPLIRVKGIDSGRIRPELRGVAVAEATGSREVTIGRRTGGVGGEWTDEAGGTVRWGDGGGWHGVTEQLWAYTAGGFPVLRKWLSYRVGRELRPEELDQFTSICRRLQALIEFQPLCDRFFNQASAHSLEVDTASALATGQ
jgi:hypothetical protein